MPAAKPAGRTLAAFVEARPRRPGPPCYACSLPEAEEIALGYRAGIGGAAIRAWLVEERGYPADQATSHRITHHLRNHVGKGTT